MSEELNEELEQEEIDEEVIEIEERKELNEFEKCIKEYLDNQAERNPFFSSVYDANNIIQCCNYIVSEVKKTKRTAFTDDEIYKLARDYFNDKKKAPKGEIKVKVIIPKKEEKEETGQLSLFDF